MSSSKFILFFIILILLSILLLITELAFGSVNIPLSDVLNVLLGKPASKESWGIIILDSRLPRALTAIVAGGGLAVSGLLMQTFFRNALAGPSVLGITSGSSLGVAFVLLITGGLSFSGSSLGLGLAVSLAALGGAFAVLTLVIIVARYLRDPVTLLIFGLMLGYITSAMVSVMQFSASDSSLKSFVLWGMGSFADTSWSDFGILLIGVIIGIILIFTFLRHLNVLLLGEEYASSMGVPVKRIRLMIILSTGILAGIITAFCGPVAFLGLAVPHLSRGLFKTSNHYILLPGVILCGIVLGLACDLISRMPWTDGGLPLNAVTGIVGAPVVIYIILKRRRTGGMI